MCATTVVINKIGRLSSKFCRTLRASVRISGKCF